MDYLAIKAIHQTAVALSVTGFFARGLGSFAGAGWVRGRLAKTLPHIVDSVLLISALVLVWLLRPPLASSGWLLAKIVGLLVYIALGMVALRPGRPVGLRAAAWIAALVTFGWVVSVAITKNALGFMALLGG